MQRLSTANYDEPIVLRVWREIARNPVQGLAGEDDLLRYSQTTGQPGLRFWVNAPCIVLGRGYARRLPRPVERVGQYPVLARASGGEIVIHDAGILNVSFAIPTLIWSGSIHDAFKGLSGNVARVLLDWGWDATIGEVPYSYCPGDHDVAVAGLKVMGISQRRLRDVVMVHGSINVAIDPEAYRHTLLRFYELAHIADGPVPERIGTLYPYGTIFDPREDALVTAFLHALMSYWSDVTQRPWRIVSGGSA